MSFILKFILGLFLLIIIWDRLTRKYVQKYQINMVIGKPGVGKSTFLTKLACDYIRRGYNVYSTEPIQVEVKNPKTHKKNVIQVKAINVKELYRYTFPPDSVLLLDEIGIDFNNRKFKAWDERNTAMIKLYRHDKLIIWGFSQSFDVDKTFRNCVTQFWILEKYARVLTVARRLVMKPVVVHPTGDAPSSIQDDFTEDPKLMRPILGGMKLCYLPKYVNLFDSWELPEKVTKLRDIDYSEDEAPMPRKKIYHAKWDKVKSDFISKKAQAVVACKTSVLKLRKVLGV